METTKIGARASDRIDDFNSLMFVINRAISNKVNTVELVKVVSVGNNRVDVIPVVDKTDNYGNKVPSSILYGVRIMRYQAGTNAVIIDPKVGDFGLILVCKRDISNPDSGIIGTNAEYNLNNCVYIGGVLGLNQTPTELIEFTDNGINITSTKTVNITAPTVNLGGSSGVGVARIGDSVNPNTMKIESGSSIVRSA